MRQKGIKQADLAEMAGVRREHINRVINSKIIPSVYLGIRIAKALGVQVEDLFIIEQ